MDRTRPEPKDSTPVFLAKAGALGERAARAMCPNGGAYPLASPQVCNVITLQNDMAGVQENDFSSVRHRGEGKCLSARRPGNGETASRGAANEH